MSRHQISLGVTTALLVVILTTTEGPTRWGLITALILAQSLLAAAGVSLPQWRWFGHSLCRGHPDQLAVALTFDDGPDPAVTPRLLDLFQRKGAVATFFWVGERAAQHPDLVQRAAREGHLLGNHSWAHHRATNLFSVARLTADLARTQEILTRLGGSPPAFFRPPMGLTNGRVFRATAALGLQVVGWTARAFDQQPCSAEQLVDRLLRQLRPGAIFALHDQGVPPDRQLAALELLMDKLHARGYQCRRLDDLLAAPMPPPAGSPSGRSLPAMPRTVTRLLLTLTLALGPLATQAQSAPTLDDIARALRNVTNLCARFTQDRHLAIFTEPLHTEGWLCSAKPGRIRWEITQPYRSVLVSDGSRVAQFEHDGQHWKKLDLGLEDAVQRVVSQIAGVVEGQYTDSRREFNAAVSSGADGPILTLTPKVAKLRRMLQSIEVHLAPDLSATRRVILREQGGDFTEIRFLEQFANVPLPPGTFDRQAPAPLETIQSTVQPPTPTP